MKTQTKTTEHHKKQLRKAASWLDDKVKGNYLPVVAVRRGYAEFVAYVYKVKRLGKPDVWYCLEIFDQHITQIKRICMYR